MEEILIAISKGFKSSGLIGLYYGIGTIGLSLIYRYLRFPDFSTVVSIIISGLLCVQMTNLINHWWGIPIAIAASVIIGSLIGLVTGLQIIYAKIPPILAGIITYTSATSFAYFVSDDKADLSFNENLRDSLDYVANNIFSVQSLMVAIVICFLISYLISRIFRTRLGLMILALLGTDSYIKYRHKEKSRTTIYLMMLGNGIIGLAGALAAIQNHSANVVNHNDFIYIALGGFALGSFLIKILSKNKMQDYIKKDEKPSASWKVKLANFSIGYLKYNDEEPKKLFATFIVLILSSALINVIFRTVEITVGETYNYFLKALFLFLFIGASNIYEMFSKKN